MVVILIACGGGCIMVDGDGDGEGHGDDGGWSLDQFWVAVWGPRRVFTGFIWGRRFGSLKARPFHPSHYQTNYCKKPWRSTPQRSSPPRSRKFYDAISPIWTVQYSPWWTCPRWSKVLYLRGTAVPIKVCVDFFLTNFGDLVLWNCSYGPWDHFMFSVTSRIRPAF